MTDQKDNSDPASVLGATLPPTRRVFPNIRATREYEQIQVSDAYDKAFELLKNVGGNRRKILRDVADKLVDVTGYGGLPPFEKVRHQFKVSRDDSIDAAIDILKDYMSWLPTEDSFRLTKAVGSRLHLLKKAIQEENVYTVIDDDPDKKPRACRVDKEDAEKELFGQIFLVEHDWASALANAEDIDQSTEIKPPYDHMTFEFNVNGRRVIVIARANESMTLGVDFLMTSEAPFGWVMYAPNEGILRDLFMPLLDFLYRHIKAICISLDAEVTVSEVVRAPHKLNHAREKAGKLPIADHHVIRLAHRSRVPRLEDPNGEPGTKKRLHFRRGHWRHYEDHKTWIKWMLVGNPDLGFIDKTYRL
jgi:hypothetical protein